MKYWNRRTERIILILMAISVVILGVNQLRGRFEKPHVHIEPPKIEDYSYYLEGGPLKPDGIIAYFSKSSFRSGNVTLLNDYFHQQLRQGIIRYAGDRNYQVATFSWDGGSGLIEAEKISLLIEQSPVINGIPLVGIILTPVNSFMYGSIFDSVNPFGEEVPIVTVDTALEDTAAKKVLAHVSVNNQEMAYSVASYVLSGAANLGALDGEVILILGPSTQKNSNDRLVGFSKAIDEIEKLIGRRLNLTVVANGDWSTSFGRETMNWFRRLRPKREIAVIIAANDNMALGASIELTNRKEPIPPIAGIDGNQNALLAIQRGQLAATIIQPAEALAKQSVDVLLDYATKNRKPRDRMVDVPFSDVKTP